MDPLSVTASTIALIQATVGIAKGIHFLRSLGQIPLEFSGLLNELSTLQAVAEQVKTVLQEFDGPPSTTTSHIPLEGLDPSILVSLKDDLAQTTKDLEAICDRLKTPKKQSEKRKANDKENISKWRWQREKDNIAKLQRKARQTRQDLSLCFSAFTTSQAHQQTKLTINIQEALCTSMQNISLLQAQYESVREENQALHRELQGSIAQLNQGLAEAVSRPTADHIDTEPHLKRSTSWLVVYLSAFLVPVCSSPCMCSCHRLKRSRSPSWLSSLIGGLFLEYNTIPLVQNIQCDAISCKAKSPSSLRLYYTFPLWLLARSIEIAVSWTSLTGSGSSLHLRVPRVLGRHRVWRAIQFGDMRWIRAHMAKKDIFCTDVNERGGTLAIVAIQYCRLEMAKFFIQQGCDLHSKDVFSRTVSSIAKEIMLWKSTRKQRKHERILEEFLSPLGLNTHEYQAILQGRVDTLLSSGLAGLNRLGDCGYAPLHWAIYRNDNNAVQALLAAGAEPNLLTAAHFTPLAMAAWMDCVDIAELLLNSGADVNLASPNDGTTAIYRAFGKPQILRLLSDHGGHINCFTHFGLESPLDWASKHYYDWTFDKMTQSSWAESLPCLISIGLDINNQENPNRTTPIMMALGNRNTILLDLLIDAGARLDVLDVDQSSILHYTSISPKLESIEVLRRAMISCIDPDMPNMFEITPMLSITQRMYMPDDELDPGERRVTTDEFWAFKQLIDEIRERYAEKRRLDLKEIKQNERILEGDTKSDGTSKSDTPVSINSVDACWGGSQASSLGSREGGVIRARSDCSGCEEFFDS
ncbi:ankyrin [Annulohypoxylon truncatum]|uniref:ankyrin n=1 Tax=Annulohypoxylon truncatum TaxID=327061 RepID=UPI002008718F|nr:ankyrin [Annulohypoxylon truncatum]KAI1211572.1 ankyrin [Annulohypoxylon truncatum]